MFGKVLIANRGEIAVRVARACRELGIPTVAVYSTADTDSAHLRLCDQRVCIGPAPSRGSYRNAAAIIEAALGTGADAIHPGYGFLSEDPDFAEVCEDAGLTFIGPSPDVLRLLGDKEAARAWMARWSVPLLSGDAALSALASASEAEEAASRLGYPVVLKAVAGGGGRGMSVVTDATGIRAGYAATTTAALALFGDDRVYIERYLEGARHVEVQFACDRSGGAVHVGTRDCTVQRRYQKLLEEAPAPGLPPGLADEMCSVTLQAVAECGYVGVGTAEFLVTDDGHYYFLEVNCRIQVEHPVSEMVSGLDLVREQLHLAGGGLLRYQQSGIAITGHAVECRVNAENPAQMFVPAPGALDTFTPPGGPFVRVDTHARAGYRIGADYDPLIAKVIVWGPDRDQALSRMDRALGEFDISGPGIATTIPFLRDVLADRDFRKVEHSTDITDRLLRGKE